MKLQDSGMMWDGEAWVPRPDPATLKALARVLRVKAAAHVEDAIDIEVRDELTANLRRQINDMASGVLMAANHLEDMAEAV